MISTYQQAVTARELAAAALYRAELALHVARQTEVDEWIGAAYDRLHVAVVELTAAEATLAAFHAEPLSA